jgi:hypothetical protein
VDGMSARRVIPTLWIAAVLIGCNATAASPSPSPVDAATSPVPSVAPSTATSTATPSLPSPGLPTQTPAASATPGLFKSDHYGYTVPVPAEWTVNGATETWDGVSPGSPGHDGPLVDQFTASPRNTSLWAYAAPTKLKLAAYATHTTDAAAAEHPCTEGSQKPEKNEAITVGGEPARLLTIHCGILVLIAVTIHRGSGAVFAFQDANADPSFDAEDRALFLAFLKGIRFTS